MKRNVMPGLVLLVIAICLAGCTQVKPEDARLRIGLLPIDKALPIFVAAQDKLFQAQGITVDLVTFSSAVERDAAMQAGAVDGQLSDLISVGLLNKDSDQVRAVRADMRTTPQRALFAVVAAPDSGVKSAADLKGVPVAISNNTIIEYVTDDLLQNGGLAYGDIAKVEVSKIPVRLEMLTAGKIKAATLPDPWISQAVKLGCRTIVDDANRPAPSTVITFRVNALDSKPTTVRKFLVAWEQAITALNAHPEQYAPLLAAHGLVPKALEGSYTIPTFPAAGMPTEQEVASVVQWMVQRGLLRQGLPYARMVDSRFLPTTGK